MRRFGTDAVLGISAGAAMLLLGAGIAHAAGTAPVVVGQKFSDASTAITGAGFTVVVSTTVGDQKARADCLVSNQVSRTEDPPENSSGSAVNQVLLSLNCDDGEASATTPGFSAASVEGKTAAAAAAAAKTTAPAPAS